MSWRLGDRPLTSVLLTRLRYLGDVAMTTIVAEVLRAGDPDLTLGYLCEAPHGTILAGHPALDHLHQLAVPRRGADARARVTDPGGGGGTPRGTWGMIRELRRTRYDLAIDLFFNPRSAWLLRLAGIPLRIGGAERSRRRLYTHTALRRDVPDPAALAALAPGGLGDHLCRLAPLTHVESGLDLLSWATGQFAPDTLRPRIAGPAGGIPGDAPPYLVLAPGATWPVKEWPAAAWRDLITALVSGGAPPLRILVPPGREARWGDLAAGRAEDRVRVLPALDLAGVRDLLAAARGVISVDGGVMHMAVALGVPTVALFGPTDPALWFPYEKLGPYRVLATRPFCHPCDLHHCDAFICLPDLPAATVAATAGELFGFAPGDRA